MFQHQMEGLLKEQQVTQEQKLQTEAEMNQIKQELDDKRRAEQQAHEIFQMATQNQRLSARGADDPSPLDLMHKYGPKNNTVQDSARDSQYQKDSLIPEPAKSKEMLNSSGMSSLRGYSARPPPSDVMAE